jgi:hypothetical protein
MAYICFDLSQKGALFKKMAWEPIVVSMPWNVYDVYITV